ncbi:MAG TPA: hypothetical protein VHX38_08715 [Pseudonocardiaceae bacterium]|jgi:hypothetical protein|nr:hypothetical protein [Pseudonocardiaceae bacterium]
MSNIRPTRSARPVVDIPALVETVDKTVGGVLSWVAGTKSGRDATSPTVAATEELLSWTGLTTPGSKHRRRAGRVDQP